jgi:hypothetical protein
MEFPFKLGGVACTTFRDRQTDEWTAIQKQCLTQKG